MFQQQEQKGETPMDIENFHISSGKMLWRFSFAQA